MISSRTFVTAVVVLVLMMTLVRRIKDAPEVVDQLPDVRWSEISDMNHCVVKGADLLEQRWAEFSKNFTRPVTDPTAAGYIVHVLASNLLTLPKGTFASPCKTGYTYGFPLGWQTLTNSYAKAYYELRPATERVDSASRPGSEEGAPAQAYEQLRQHIDELRARSIPLRKALEQPQIVARTQQLSTIEARAGHDQHWHTLRFMILARRTIDALDGIGDGVALTPSRLLELQQSLNSSQTEAEAFFAALPRLTAKDNKPAIWRATRAPAQEWLGHLNSLQQHWAEGAKAAELNKDLVEVRAGYDRLLTAYNAAVGDAY